MSRKKEDRAFALFSIFYLLVFLIITSLASGVNPIYPILGVILALAVLSPVIFVVRYFIRSYLYYSGRLKDGEGEDN